MNKRIGLTSGSHFLSYWIVFCIAIMTVSITSCFEESFESSSPVSLSFSTDTLRFDTVFTTTGSATRIVKIFNTSDQNLTISSVVLSKGDESMFRMNVDGINGSAVENIKLLANDSLYIFVEVTVDPDQPLSESPFIIEEFIQVSAGNTTGQIVLEAWGQNANYFPRKDAKGKLIRLTCENNNVTWDDDKPYVVFGLLFIDSCELIVAPGTQIYVHGGLARMGNLVFSDGGIIFLPSGKLNARGTAELPIVFQGDRLESGFQDVSGQWSGIRFLNGSRGHVLDYVTIKNSIVGIRADSSSEARLTSCRIFNTSNVGLIGLHADLKVDNSLIHSTAGQSCILAYGGNYVFRHCTLANYENQVGAIYLDNFNCLDPDCSAVDIYPLQATFLNSIIAGSNSDEIDIADATEGMDPSMFQLIFDHTLIAIDEVKAELEFSEVCQTCIEYDNEPLFIDPDEDIYELDTLSIARDQGILISDLLLDLNNRQRDRESPDLGCFEFKL